MNIHCPSCEAANREDAELCSMCGRQLKTPPVEPSKKPPDPTPSVKPKTPRLPSCRECGHRVGRSAKTCPSCGATSPATSTATQLVIGAIAFACFLSVLLTFSSIFDSFTPFPSFDNDTPYEKTQGEGNASMARVMIHDFVQARLASPSSAEFPGIFEMPKVQTLGNNRYRLRSWVDSQNTFGALLRASFVAVVREGENDKGKLESLTFGN